MAHRHEWAVDYRPGGWAASCACGLAVAVEEWPGGRSIWEWTLDGRVPPPAVMLDAVGSVTRARRELLTGRPGRT